MASRDTRARSAAAGDCYLCPLPQVPLDEGAVDSALEALYQGAHTLSAVVREGPQGQPALIAEGYESPVAMSQKVDGKMESGTARRVRGRSVRQAHAAAAALRARVAKAMAQLEALNQRGRGNKRFETVSAFRQAVVAIVQRDGVEHLVWFRLTPHVTSRPGRAYRGQPDRVDSDRQATVAVGVDAAAWGTTIGRVGWRVYGTNQPLATLSREPAVLAYRSA
jgi:hypothetical protein